MDRVFEARLIECLSALENNEPVEQILARYPEDVQRLRPILQVAAALPGLVIEPRPEPQENSRRKLLAAAEMLASSEHRGARRSGRGFAILEVLGAAIMVLSVSAMLLAISGSALPGTPLYGVKRAVEGARLVLTTQDDARGMLERQLNQERIDEIRALLTGGGQAEAAFEGTIEAIQPDVWQVSGLDVTITASTQITGDPQVGLTVQVQGQVAGGKLLADTITVEQTAEPAPGPAATVGPVGSPTSHPTPAPSLVSTPTPLPPRTPTPLSMTPVPSAPTEEDNTNDNEDDEDNDNGGDNDNTGDEDDG